MIIQMIYQMSGGRYDGRSWPVTGVNFEVPDEEGGGLVGAGAAIYVGESVPAAPPAVPVAPAPAVADSTAVEPEVSTPAVAEQVMTADLASEPEPAPEPVPPPPAPGDPKAAWVAHAVSRGAPRTVAEDSTKAQLQAQYGGRM